MSDITASRDPAELRKFIANLGVAAFVIDVVSEHEFYVAAINEPHEHATGMKHDGVAGRSIDELFDPETAARVKGNYRRCVISRASTDYQETLDLPVGRTWWRTTLVPFLDRSGRVTRLLGTAYEISDAAHLELESMYQSSVISAYLDESPDGILVVDSRNRIRTWNRRFREIWDIPEDVMEQHDSRAALKAVSDQVQDPESFVRRIEELSTSLDEEEAAVRIQMKDGRVLQRYSRGLRGPRGAYWGRIWFYRDVTEQERMTCELLRLSRTDPLTGAFNRRAFMEALEEEFDRAHRYRHPLTAMTLDLDHFKQINDQYGHAAGDKALKGFVAVISPELRSSDCFARMGGEEFAVLLPETALDAATPLAERLRVAVEGLSLSSEEGPFGLTVSIGLANLRDTDTSPDQILNRADRALYRAKAQGRNRVQV